MDESSTYIIYFFTSTPRSDIYAYVQTASPNQLLACVDCTQTGIKKSGLKKPLKNTCLSDPNRIERVLNVI